MHLCPRRAAYRAAAFHHRCRALRADQVFALRIGLIEGKDELRAGMAATIEVVK